MLLTMAAAALIVDAVFTALGLVPDTRPTRDDIFGTIQLDYKLVLNVLGLIVFAALFGLTMRRGATDPVCGMKVDRASAVRLEHEGTTYYFCSEHCMTRFQTERADAGSHSARVRA
jgi:YHS domain-containing protein